MSALILPLVVFVILLVAIVAFLDSRSDVKKKTKGLNIPPGNMGWPLIGETVAFRSLHSSTALGPYMEEHKRRYGSIYRSHLFGAPTIVSADPEFNRFILLNDGKLFEPSWPRSVAAILGETSMLVATGELHRYMKAMSVNFMGVPRLREYFMGALEGFVLQAFSSWKENTPFSAKEQACSVTFNLMVKNILSLNPGEADTELLRKEYASFMKGVVSFPLNLPGTAYRKAIQSRAAIFKVIERLRSVRIKKNKEGRNEIGEADFLGFVLAQSNLSVLQICDLLLGLLFGGHETTATAITLSIYFLEGCPKAVQHLREEYLQIRAMKKQKGETSLTWDDYKQMEFTQCVISETLRLGNVIRFVHRKAVTNVHYKGYDIPEGWSVVPVFAAAHLDESAYENPGRFDPWRWQTFAAKPDNYMPFGQGLRNCAGLELAKMEMAVFLYHLVLNYDWELAEPDSPLSYAFPEFPKGLPIKVRALSPNK